MVIDDLLPQPGGGATQAPAVPAVAYLVSQYPKLSHAFVAREIEGLRARGVRVRTFSVRPTPDAELRTRADHVERASTTVLLDGARPLRALLTLAVRSPAAVTAALGLALRSGPPTPRGRLWQLFYLAEAAVLMRAMRAHGLRHVHVHLANSGADVARLATALGTRLTGRAWTWSLAVHGPTELADVTGHDLAAKVRSAAFVACISDYCRSQLMALVEPVHWAKLRVVRMSVDPQRYPHRPRPERPATSAGAEPLRVLFVGRLVPEKGPHLLLQALAALPAGTCTLRIVGDGPLRAELAARAAEVTARAAGRGVVQVLGPLGQDELPEQYAWADAFCLPSFAEGLPVVLMEAMATGLPVLTTRIAGIPELVDDGTSGLLVAPGRADLLGAALQRLAQDEPLRRRLGQQAAQVVRARHDGDSAAAALHQLFTDHTRHPNRG